jgi:hypothetical protein
MLSDAAFNDDILTNLMSHRFPAQKKSWQNRLILQKLLAFRNREVFGVTKGLGCCFRIRGKAVRRI